MDILKKFTIRNLLLNKKRTIVTIIGIVLSTALICGTVGLVASARQTLLETTKRSTGNYHTKFYDVPKDELKYIQENINVESYFLTDKLGVARLSGSKNKYKPYLQILEYDKNALNNNGVILTEGRLPENSNELLISEHIKDNGRVKLNVGDKVTLDIGKRIDVSDGFELNNDVLYDEERTEDIVDTARKTYTIVGVMKRPDYSIESYSAPVYTVVTCMDGVRDKADIAVLYTKPRECASNNKMINPDKKYDQKVNSELLRYEGVMGDEAMMTIIGIASVIMTIIVVSSVFVIRNSFSISVSEKSRQYGMLSSIGATKRQIKRSVVFEGFIIGLIAIPIGILCGVIGIVILLKVVNYLLADALNGYFFEYSLPFIPMLVAVIVSFVTIYLSCIIPAHRASKISPIEAIRGNNDIKIKSKKLKVPGYVGKLFGIGGVIASKNLKRNKKKYRTTVVSIVVSIVIFISLFSFIYYGNRTSRVYYTEMKYNVIVYASDSNAKDVAYNISRLDGVDKFAYSYSEISELEADKYCTEFGKDIVDSSEGANGVSSISIYTYNNEYFKEYLKEVGVSEEKYKDGVVLIDDIVEEQENGQKVFKNIYNIKTGDTVDIDITGRKGNQVKVLKKTDKRPMGLEGTYFYSGAMIVSEDFMDDLPECKNLRMYINSDNASMVENEINDLIDTDDRYADMSVTNYQRWAENENRMILVISIFLYGFISVITLIGVTNIFNTITTNMILRSKEFAMLKSVGMTTKEFNKMIRLENIMYGIKSLLIGIPLGILGSLFIYFSYARSVDSGYVLPWQAIIICIVFVFIIVGITMRYSLNKINKQNIIETIINDNI